MGLNLGIGIGLNRMGRQGELLNLTDVLAITIGGTEYYVTMNIEGQEFYISF